MEVPLKNQRHELFAQAIAKGSTADAAYAKAGFKPNRSNAARLNANERIVRRVAELQASAAKRTIEHIALSDADFISRLIREADHYGEGSSHSARVQAVRLIGDHLGLLKARVEHDVSDALTDLIAQVQGCALPIATARR